MLAPIGKSTGDGRRFTDGALSLAPVPFPFEWARERSMGHDGAVVIGVVEQAEIRDGGVWAEGQFFDDADRETMPRLAEDVAEAMLLVEQGALGPSVDLDSFDGIPVVEGTDSPPEEAEWDDPDIKIELLVTEGRVRAATLVSVPAFVETVRPLELLDTPDEERDEQAATKLPALVASMTTLATDALPALASFDRPEPAEPTPLTIDWDTGEVYGHVAEWQTCHLGFDDMCVVPPRNPRDDGEYVHFNRFPVETREGELVWAGRLTAGGRHPGLELTASATINAYDGKPVAAHVRARDGKLGLWVSGVVNPNLDERTKRVLSRRKPSGDWRETADGLSMVELLALSPGPRLHSEPGFPVATHSHHGRQTALTAALGPSPDGAPRRADYVDMQAEIRAQLAVEREREAGRAELAAIVAVEREAARAKLAAAFDIPVESLEEVTV